MNRDFPNLAADVRMRASALVRSRHDAIASDVATRVSLEDRALDVNRWRECAERIVHLLATGIESSAVDSQSATMRELAHYCPPLTTPGLVRALHEAERVVLDEIALDDRLGATSDPWPIVAHAVRRATLDLLAAYADHIAGRDVPVLVRDGLTTLIAAPVFEIALAQEIERALRHQHAIAALLFDIDHLAGLNHAHGFGVGDRVLERMGILARRFFRTHDWVARYGDDSIAVLLPETTLDQAAALAVRFREAVEQRMVLPDYKSNVPIRITISAAAVGTDLVQSGIEPGYLLAEAEAAVQRAKLDGHHRVEHVALLPTSVTIFGAAVLLGGTPREIVRLIRSGSLRASRRGRHLHIDRANIEEFRKTAR